MKNQLAILAMGVLAANAVFLAPAQAQTEGKFYCSQAYDPLTKTNMPATVMSSPNRVKPLVVVLWKSEYFGKDFSPQRRCAIVSPKFQAALVSGSLEYLKVGKERNTRQDIVCAVKTANARCDRESEMLFALKPYGNNNYALKTLMANIEGGQAGPIIYQGSGGEEVADLRTLLKSR
jgi:hypothetical protein